MSAPRVDLGSGHWYEPTGLYGAEGWHGVIVGHVHDDGTECKGAVLFDTPEVQAHGFTDRPKWQVVSRDPLTLTPSILRKSCGDHGYITDGRWVSA